MSRVLRILLLGVVLVAGPAGCGWLGASSAPRVKPDTFVLRGHVTVPVPAADSRPDGAACAATVPDVVAGAPVRVTDPNGHELATGTLGDGVIAGAASLGSSGGKGTAASLGSSGGTGTAGSAHSCDFPFQIAGVPGGVDSYAVAVGNRPAQTFPAKQLRENASAVITLTS